jgi:uncharacterized repeat protein (TIGR03803 family)
MIQLRSCLTACGIFLLSIAAAIPSRAQTFTTLLTFDVSDGALPMGTLVQGLDGNFYGTTEQGGRHLCDGGCGTVFKIAPEGTLTTLHEFVKGTDGYYPEAGLALATNGNFYGLAASTAFEITSAGSLTVLNSSTSGSLAALVEDTVNGNFYGTTLSGGTQLEGSVFAMTPSGSVATLKDFCERNTTGCFSADGFAPAAPLLWDIYDGLFYGTTSAGGNRNTTFCLIGGGPYGEGCGTVFVIGAGGALKTLYRFTGETDGASPLAGLVQGTDGNFYGTTYSGASNQGTVFKITPAGAFTTLYDFCPQGAPCDDGSNPRSGLVQATDGNFYGTTNFGGSFGDYGTVFKITPDGTLTTIHSFCASGIPCSDGLYPVGGLVQGTDGNLYGTTMGENGKSFSEGTVFKISLGLPPFVKILQPGAQPGIEITILGTDLTGATSVTFNGTAAEFTVVSATEIDATVPAGATTGTVEVTTPSGTQKSNVAFRVF